MSESATQSGDEPEDPTEYASPLGLGWGEIVANCSIGDRVHLRFPDKEGRVDWRSYWVHDAGDEYIDCGDWRVEIADDSEVARGQVGDRGVRLLKHGALGYYETDRPSIGGIEHVPREEFKKASWTMWEVGTTLGHGEALPSDKTVITEAPSRDVAIEKALRWADQDGSGSARVVYEEDPIELRSERDLYQKRREMKFEQDTRVCELCSNEIPGGLEAMVEHIEDDHSLEDLVGEASFSWTPDEPRGFHHPNGTIHFAKSNSGTVASMFCGRSFSRDDFEDTDCDWKDLFSYELGDREDYCGSCITQLTQGSLAVRLPPVLEGHSCH